MVQSSPIYFASVAQSLEDGDAEDHVAIVGRDFDAFHVHRVLRPGGHFADGYRSWTKSIVCGSIVYARLVPTSSNYETINTRPSAGQRALCLRTTLQRDPRAARFTAILRTTLFEPLGLKQTQYFVLARLDRLVHCNLGELAKACDLNVTSLSRGTASAGLPTAGSNPGGVRMTGRSDTS